MRLSSSKLLVTEALTVSSRFRILATSSSAKPGKPANVSAMVGFLNCGTVPAVPIMDQRDIIGMGSWGRKLFMLLMRSEAESRPWLLEAAEAAAAATEFCIIEVENRRGFSKRGLDKAIALAAIAAKK